jgi:uncharacterized membrane protein
MRLNKKTAVIAGVVVALGSAGTALATTITIAPTVGPTVAPVLVAPSVANTGNVIDAFQLNSHNDNDSEFIDFSNGLNVLYNTVQLGDPHNPVGLGGLGGLVNIGNILSLVNLPL